MVRPCGARLDELSRRLWQYGSGNMVRLEQFVDAISKRWLRQRSRRFASDLRQEPYEVILHVRIFAGAAGNSRPECDPDPGENPPRKRVEDFS